MVCFIQMEWFSRDFCWFDHFALWRSHSMCLKSFNIFHSCTYQGLMMSMGTWWIIGWRTCTPLNTPRRDYIQLYVCMHVTISSWCLAHTLTKLSQDVSPKPLWKHPPSLVSESAFSLEKRQQQPREFDKLLGNLFRQLWYIFVWQWTWFSRSWQLVKSLTLRVHIKETRHQNHMQVVLTVVLTCTRHHTHTINPCRKPPSKSNKTQSAVVSHRFLAS